MDHYMIRQELNPETCKLDGKQINLRCILWIMEVLLNESRWKNCRYVKGTSPLDITVTSGRLRWHRNQSHTCAPCIVLRKGRRQRKEKERSFTSIQMLHTHTHTHPAGAGSTLKGKRKKKADTRRANGQKQRMGGEGNRRTSGTNLHGETDLTKTAHTPKPHDTLRRGTRGKLGTKWGTSWCQTKNKTIS